MPMNQEITIWLTECSAVQLVGNLLSDPRPSLKVRVDRTATATGTGFEDGVLDQPAANGK